MGLASAQEGDIDPVVARVVAARWKTAGASVGVDAVAAARPAGRSRERPGCMRGAEVVAIARIETVRVVGDDVGRSGNERHGPREVDLLPAAGGFIGKRGDGKQRACGAP